MPNANHRPFGNLRQLPSGRWQARWRGPDGHLHKAPGTFATRRQAETWLSRVRVERADRTWIDERDGALPVAAVAETWKASLVHLRPSTLARDVDFVDRYILADDRIAARPVGDLAASECQAWVSRLRAAGLAPRTVNKAAQLLAAVIDVAIADKRRAPADNPARGLKLPRADDTEMATLGRHEIGRLADAINPRYRPLIIFACHTGLRMGELVGLTAADIDLVRRTVRVARTVSEVSGRLHHGAPKTRAGRRSVPLNDAALVAVEPLALAARHPDDLIFTAPAGGYLRLGSFRTRYWRPATTAIGRPELRLHDMRHTAITLWVQAGIDPKAVATWAGHTSMITVLDRYAHYRDDQNDINLAKLDAYLDVTNPRRDG